MEKYKKPDLGTDYSGIKTIKKYVKEMQTDYEHSYNEDILGYVLWILDDYKKMKQGDGTNFSRITKITQTNEEWLHTLNTEQKAEWLTNVINTNPCGYLLFCDECSLNDKCKEDDYPTNTETWVEWLKQPHKPFS